MFRAAESPASLARRRLHEREDATNTDSPQEVNGATLSEKQPDDASFEQVGVAAQLGVDTCQPTSSEEPKNPVAWLAPLFHLGMTLFYALLLYYGMLLMDEAKLRIIDPTGKIPAYAGRFKFLTHINEWVQLFVFGFLFITDVIPRSSFKETMIKLGDILVTTVAFPLAWFIVLAFWGIYAYDRKYIYPEAFDKIVPVWMNHFWHTTIGVFILFEVLLVYHRFPKSGLAASLSFTLNAAYIAWMGWIYGQTNFMVYPIIAVLPLPILVLFFASCMFFSFSLFFCGKRVSSLRWGLTSEY